MSVLTTVQKFFPGVTQVVDANRPTKIEVTKQDASSKGLKNHEACALAVACKNRFHLDGVIISRTTAYLVKGKKARRFQLPPSVGREIVSYDRGAGFAPGTYTLSAVTKNKRMGARQSKSVSKTGAGAAKQFRHITTGVRTVLGGQDPD